MVGGLLESALRDSSLLEETLKKTLQHCQRLEGLTLARGYAVGDWHDYLVNSSFTWTRFEAMLTSSVFRNLPLANLQLRNDRRSDLLSLSPRHRSLPNCIFNDDGWT